jgi:hypothetical protein
VITAPAVAQAKVFCHVGFSLYHMVDDHGKPVLRQQAKRMFSSPAVAGDVVLIG